MRETRTSGSMRGIVETEPMVQPLRHRQTKEAATDMLNLPALRHIPTLPPSHCMNGGLCCANPRYGLVAVIEVWFIGDAVKASPFGDQLTTEGRSSGGSEFVDIDELPGEMDGCVPVGNGAAGTLIRFFLKPVCLPFWRLTLEFKENSPSSWKLDYSEIVFYFDTAVEQEPTSSRHYIGRNGTSDDRPLRFANIGKMKENDDRFPLKYRADIRFPQDNPGPVSREKFIPSEGDGFISSAQHSASGPPKGKSERSDCDGSQRSESSTVDIDKSAERHRHFVSGAIVIVGVVALAIFFIGLKD